MFVVYKSRKPQKKKKKKIIPYIDIANDLNFTQKSSTMSKYQQCQCEEGGLSWPKVPHQIAFTVQSPHRHIIYIIAG